MRSFDQLHIAIVGAGLSGVACARRLRASGIRSTLFDRGFTPGGRLSSRRVPLGDASFDFNHGAPLIHAQTVSFQHELKSWVDAGIADWVDKPRVVAGLPRTQSVLEHLAEGLSIDSSRDVQSVRRIDQMWEVTTMGFEDSEPVLHKFDSVLFACPSVQARRLLAVSPGELGDRCPELPSSTKWVCMLVIDDEAGNCRNLDQVEVDQQHGVESIRIEDRHENQVALVVTMNDEWSKSHQLYTKDDALPLLVEASSNAICSLMNLDQSGLSILHARSHRWGLARATAWVEEACDYDPDLRLGFAGDWFSGPEGRWRDAEAAFLSGVSLAEAVVGS